MFLKNYTSEVPASKTIARIEEVLIKCGVSGITKSYGPTPGEIIAIIFHIDLNGVDYPFRLCPDVAKCRDALWKDYAGKDKLTADGTALACCRTKTKRRKDFEQQAARTAWKLVQDEVEVQMSRIQLEQADFREAFLPYLWDGKQTYFQRLAVNKFAALLPEKSTAE